MLQESVCESFEKRDDGIWVATKPYDIPGPTGMPIRVGPGMEFRLGLQHMGLDIANWLEENGCE